MPPIAEMTLVDSDAPLMLRQSCALREPYTGSAPGSATESMRVQVSSIGKPM